jgi:hypothetical protein
MGADHKNSPSARFKIWLAATVIFLMGSQTGNAASLASNSGGKPVPCPQVGAAVIFSLTLNL